MGVRVVVEDREEVAAEGRERREDIFLFLRCLVDGLVVRWRLRSRNWR